MVHQPPVLILDEPTAGVDVELRRQLWAYVQELNRKGVTIVLTTHYLEEAQALCDTIAIVNHGQVVACEPTRTLLGRIDTKSVVVTPEEPLQSVPPLGGFEGKLRADGSLAITFHTKTTHVEAVLGAVRAAGVGIKDLSTEDPDLEDVFLALTYDDPTAQDPTREVA
jgi:ABC-2 type transport system ATP-binding protein